MTTVPSVDDLRHSMVNIDTTLRRKYPGTFATKEKEKETPNGMKAETRAQQQQRAQKRMAARRDRREVEREEQPGWRERPHCFTFQRFADALYDGMVLGPQELARLGIGLMHRPHNDKDNNNYQPQRSTETTTIDAHGGCGLAIECHGEGFHYRNAAGDGILEVAEKQLSAARLRERHLKSKISRQTEDILDKTTETDELRKRANKRTRYPFHRTPDPRQPHANHLLPR
ncbi:unnamed protein product [Vitrella brassicaformis CCMP3155]|uniref:Uncharacterized protein n=2 Tax=Vitrella brassicaformis TaxID=1169539 RepID=A0A0G4GAA3_VITBC|nr:unnamed protein product [Vitrella brassicaformis CCMP3155]|eukprot:CEM25878.1 unnamed protein product [Vitrella brassicaformis CCMP3155]